VREARACKKKVKELVGGPIRIGIKNNVFYLRVSYKKLVGGKGSRPPYRSV